MGQKYKSMPKYLATAVAIAAVYLLAAKFGLKLAFFNPSATPVWPPTGIAIAALLLLGYRFWPSIFLGAFFANLAITPVLASLGIAAGNTLEGISGAYLINRFAGGKNVFNKTQNIFKFLLLAAILSTALSATIGTTILLLGGFAAPHAYLWTWLTWWIGDAVGAMLIVPPLVLWSQNCSIKWKTSRMVEFAALLLVLLLTTVTIFLGWFPGETKSYPLAFLVIPILIWAGLRFKQREVTIAMLLLSGIALLGNLKGVGPFVVASKNGSLLITQAFMGVVSMTGLVLASLVSATKESEEKIRESLEEKGILLKELHHRVKNNLQLMSSILSLQVQGIKDKSASGMLKESRNRIRSMALVHESLYQSENVDFSQYVKKLVKNLFSSYGISPDKIKIVVKTPKYLKTDYAVVCGLIISELVANSLKHAFPGVKKGKIEISLVSHRDRFILSVSDNGKGISPNLDWEKTKSLGLQIVMLLAGQLNGSVKLDRRKGTSFAVSFPKKSNA